ncbi:MAG TPA: hypothetical protein DCY13_12275, partial [Verrucomicrobiales bacterium]|nr:hypothetical protein [Verrucomicrobiales bacterium]
MTRRPDFCSKIFPATEDFPTGNPRLVSTGAVLQYPAAALHPPVEKIRPAAGAKTDSYDMQVRNIAVPAVRPPLPWPAPAFALAALLTASISVCAAPHVTGDARMWPGIDRGELLFGELNCVACHGAGEPVNGRLQSKAAPRLDLAGDRLTPQFLRSFLANPHLEKPGTTMPDALGHLPAAEKADTVEALVHFLSSLRSGEEAVPTPADPSRVAQGRRLFHKVGCVTCHEPEDPSEGMREIPASLREQSVPLGNLAHKTTVAELAKFLIDPLKTRPGGRMPSLALNGNEALAIATYLLREQAPGLVDPSQLDKIAGLKFHYFEFRQNREAEMDGPTAEFLELFPGNANQARGRVRHVKSGVIDKPGIGQRDRDDHFGFLFEGLINVPADGEYTFHTSSDDGSRLYIDGELVVNNDGEHGTTERSGKVTLTKGDHGIRVTYFELGGGEELTVSWQGPDFRKQVIPGGVFSHLGQAMRPTGAIEFALDATRAAKGRMHFQQLGCANCHGVPEQGPALVAAFRLKSLAELMNPNAGCLAEEPSGQAVNYHLSPEQRIALRQTVANRAALSQPLVLNDSIHHTLTRLNCYACHYRDAIGGPVEERRGYFTAIGETDLGDEGRMPPHLTSVGR